MAVIEITAGNFDELVLKSSKPVLLDFWATWCGPCRMQAPIFDGVCEEIGDAAVFGKVNVDEQSDLAREFNVMSIPTIICIANGEIKSMNVGVQDEDSLKNMLK